MNPRTKTLLLFYPNLARLSYM